MVDCKPMLIDRPRHWLRQRVPLCASDFQLDLEGDIGTCSFARLLGHCLVRLARENPIKTLFPSTPLAPRDYLDYWSASHAFILFQFLSYTNWNTRFKKISWREEFVCIAIGTLKILERKNWSTFWIYINIPLLFSCTIINTANAK